MVQVMRGLTAIVCMTSLSGCATYSKLYTAPVNQVVPSNGVSVILKDAHEIQAGYAEAYRRSSQYSDISQIPIIGAAAAVATILLDNGKHAAKTAGYIGIGVGAYAAVRSVFLPTGTAELYLKGHNALACIRNQGPLFVDAAAASRFQTLHDATATLQLVLADAKAKSTSQFEADASENEKRQLEDAKKLLADVIAAGGAVYQKAMAEQLMVSSAEAMFGSAVSAVTTRIATKGREGRAVDFDSLKTALTANIPDATPSTATDGGPPAPAAAPAPPRSNGEILSEITGASLAVSAATHQLSAATPPYSKALEAVEDCPSTI